MPLSVEKFGKLTVRESGAQKLAEVIICACGARNIPTAKNCWKCNIPFQSARCPILPNWMTNKSGRCERVCSYRGSVKCIARG